MAIIATILDSTILGCTVRQKKEGAELCAYYIPIYVYKREGENIGIWPTYAKISERRRTETTEEKV